MTKYRVQIQNFHNWLFGLQNDWITIIYIVKRYNTKPNNTKVSCLHIDIVEKSKYIFRCSSSESTPLNLLTKILLVWPRFFQLSNFWKQVLIIALFVLSVWFPEASFKDCAGVCRVIHHLLAPYTCDIPPPLLPLWPGGHINGPLRCQCVCSNPGLHQLLRQPFCSVLYEQELPQAVQKTVHMLVPYKSINQSKCWKHTDDISLKLHSVGNFDFRCTGFRGTLRTLSSIPSTLLYLLWQIWALVWLDK